MAVLIKNITTYQKTKPAYDAYRAAKDKGQYRAALQAEYTALQEQKDALYADYGKLKKQVKEYDVIKRNIDSLLRQDKQPERVRETER